ncbi:MAG: DinG family ATP-dependent helicase YoaA [Frankiales bacterium]|nr:DinG family ATP-dependent helicase YoaA [Frankiales bacterium]
MGQADRAVALLDAVLEGLPGSDERAGQREMVRAVAEALQTGDHLLVQAGTGTGKSLGYLVPALAVRRRVLVATATKALQAQLVEKDLPRVVEAVRRRTGREVTFALAKGRRNYLCLERVHGDDGQGTLELGELERDDAQVTRLREWADETESGDRDEVDFAIDDAAWRAVSVDGRDCLGARCPWRDDCFAERARTAAQEADVVVANHSMLALDVCTEAQVLPERDVVIVDEAHDLDRFVTEALTAELSAAGTARVVRLAAALLKEETRIALGRSLGDVDALLAELPDGLLSELPDHARLLLEALHRNAEAAAVELAPADDGEDADSRDHRAKAALRELAGSAAALLAAGPHHALHVVRGKPGVSGVLRVSPLRVDGRLADRLLRFTPVIATSATLAVDGEFSHVARQLGFGRTGDDDEQPRMWSGIDVGSPFDYPRQAQLYVASDLPDPRDRDAWAAAVDERVVALLRAAGGRTLALFSSRSAARRAAEAARRELDLPVLLQGEDTDSRLAWRFAQDARTCLFATRGYWQGIDVPGSACQLVIIDRLPFTYLDNPLHKARVDAAGGGFTGFSLVAVPEAAIALAQGVGRLIRRADDRGVVAVLDPRLQTASYRHRLLRSLPPLYRTTSLDQVLRSLQAIDAAAPPPLPVGPEPAKRRVEAARAQASVQATRKRQAVTPQPTGRWTEDEDGLLRAGIKAGRPVEQLAQRHEVTVVELEQRLRELGLVG